jgi:pimeloyl-ACP methyl ester carboxylesterase
MSTTIERRTCVTADGVQIVYSAAGAGKPGLVFVHGGLANRGFWESELYAFSPRYRVVALDLPGHGESGENREHWGIPEFGADVCAVIEAERLSTVVLFGNSLGGPVAGEAALRLGARALGVVGVDTFQRLDYTISPEQATQRADAFGGDYAGSLAMMVKALFHQDVDPALAADAERRMAAAASPDTIYRMFASFAGYSLAASVRRLAVPLRAINGDLHPTDLAANRSVAPGFDAVVMPHVGHYPMLERPGEFDRHVSEVVQALVSVADRRSEG